jgi:hypothetical protein
MKNIKKFLLFTARDNFQVVVIFIIFGVPLYLLALINSLGLSSETIRFSWLAMVIFLLALIDLIVVRMKITSFFSISSRSILVYGKHNQPKIYQTPIWGKPEYKIIHFPKDFGCAYLKNQGCNVKVSLEVEILGRHIFLPFFLNFRLIKAFQASELHELIMLQDIEDRKKNHFFFNECIQSIFIKFNEENMEAIEKVVGELLYANIKKLVVLAMIVQTVKFPKDLFIATIAVTLIEDELKIVLFDREQPLY